ncbi:MAG: HisA/HisF-related TIM barrel protein, partial [Ginsengibacter sp.]
SMNNDGMKGGFAEDITARFSGNLEVPIIASGGAGTMQDFADVFTRADADAALAASVFHFDEIKIPELKEFLSTQNINVRL